MNISQCATAAKEYCKEGNCAKALLLATLFNKPKILLVFVILSENASFATYLNVAGLDNFGICQPGFGMSSLLDASRQK